MQIISRSEAKSQNLKHYFTGKPCKHGHASERYVIDGKCCDCVRNRAAQWSKDNPERKRQQKADYYAGNKGAVLTKAKEYRDTNRDEINGKRSVYYKTDEGKAARKRYRDANREKINKAKMNIYYLDVDKHRAQKRNDHIKHRESRNIKSKNYRVENKDKLNKYFVNRRANDEIFKMNAYMRNMICRVLKRSYSDKTNTTVIMLGYTADQLVEHIESLFVEGMSWDNYGEWHIDHIVPVKWWLDNGVTDPSMINALINLQPLWAVDNLIKGCKI